MAYTVAGSKAATERKVCVECEKAKAYAAAKTKEEKKALPKPLNHHYCPKCHSTWVLCYWQNIRGRPCFNPKCTGVFIPHPVTKEAKALPAQTHTGIPAPPPKPTPAYKGPRASVSSSQKKAGPSQPSAQQAAPPADTTRSRPKLKAALKKVKG